MYFSLFLQKVTSKGEERKNLILLYWFHRNIISVVVLRIDSYRQLFLGSFSLSSLNITKTKNAYCALWFLSKRSPLPWRFPCTLLYLWLPQHLPQMLIKQRFAKSFTRAMIISFSLLNINTHIIISLKLYGMSVILSLCKLL